MKSVVVVVVSLSALAGCTSFAFKNTGRGSAPDELKSRSAMVAIKGGPFDQGAMNAEPDEYPPHKVEVSSFVIDKTEVTVGAYGRCVQAHVCRAPSLDDDAKEGVTDAHPVVGVSWNDAARYCEWVGKRLPTEAEWEYAARAPRMGKFPWDGRYDATVTNTSGSADGFERTAPVGSFPKGASGYGLLDMGGNAAEWVADWYDAVYYGKLCGITVVEQPKEGETAKPVGDCKVTHDPKGPEASTGSKVVRGGSWVSNGDYLVRATSRTSLDPNVSNDAVGFRCAADK